ncbi:MAG: toxin-antitoxin system YwqK family antitoxin [Phycisphaerales bacterium]
MKRRTDLVIAAAAICVLVGTGSFWVFSEKDIPHSSNEQWMTAHYRGLGQDTKSTGLMGYMWTGMTMKFDDGGYYRAEFKAPGFNPFVGYYPDGSKREVGTCWVEMVNSNPVMPSAVFSYVDTSRCYKPDGSLGSEVRNGTGVQKVWLPDGTKVWELHLQNHIRTLHRRWHDNGQLSDEKAYEDGAVHGPFTSYYPDGKVQTTGEYDLGKNSGVWTHFWPDGTVMSTKDYRVSESE